MRGRERHVRNGPSIARKLGGVWLTLLGLAGDGIACYLIVTQQPAILDLLAHASSVGIWTLGIHLLASSTSPASSEPARRGIIAPSLSGWTVASALLGLFLFPGIGTASVSFAFLCSYLFRRRRLPHLTLSETLASMKMPAVNMRAAGLEHASQVLPIVDILRQEKTEYRRAVVRTLGDQGDRESVKTLRRLLSDTNPDVRSDASVILTRLENEYQQRILNASQRVEHDPHDTTKRLQLARLYFQVADSGLLDQVSNRYYLAKACEMYQRETAAQPGRIDLLIDLARVYSHLDRPRDAIKLLLFVLQQESDNPTAMLLLLEVAFAEQEWGILLSVAQDARMLDVEQNELLRWWTEIIPPTWKGVLHG